MVTAFLVLAFAIKTAIVLKIKSALMASALIIRNYLVGTETLTSVIALLWAQQKRVSFMSQIVQLKPSAFLSSSLVGERQLHPVPIW